MINIKHSEFLQLSLKNNMCFIDLFEVITNFKEFLKQNGRSNFGNNQTNYYHK